MTLILCHSPFTVDTKSTGIRCTYIQIWWSYYDKI